MKAMKKTLLTALAATSMAACLQLPMATDAEARHRHWRRDRVVHVHRYRAPRVRYHRHHRHHYHRHAYPRYYYGPPVIVAPRPVFGVTFYAR